MCVLYEDLGVRCRVGNHKSLPEGKSIVTQQFLGRIHNNAFLISDIFTNLVTEKKKILRFVELNFQLTELN